MKTSIWKLYSVGQEVGWRGSNSVRKGTSPCFCDNEAFSAYSNPMSAAFLGPRFALRLVIVVSVGFPVWGSAHLLVCPCDFDVSPFAIPCQIRSLWLKFSVQVTSSRAHLLQRRVLVTA